MTKEINHLLLSQPLHQSGGAGDARLLWEQHESRPEQGVVFSRGRLRTPRPVATSALARPVATSALARPVRRG